MSEEQRQPWERQTDEPNKWFQRFDRFRLLGPGRSLMAIYRAEWEERVARSRKESQRTPRQVSGRWRFVAETFAWIERAEAWDDYQAAERQATIDRAQAEFDALWREKHMRAAEVLGRLAEMGRSNPADFIVREPQAITHGSGENTETVWIESASLNWDALKARGHLVKKISFNQYGPIIEMRDTSSAIEKVGEHLELFRQPAAANLNIDLSSLTDDQLERIANGEDPVTVMATSSAGRE